MEGHDGWDPLAVSTTLSPQGHAFAPLAAHIGQCDVLAWMRPCGTVKHTAHMACIYHVYITCDLT